MKTKRRLKIVGIICGVSFASGAYCFWLMTVPLSYQYVYIVVGGFLVSLLVFVVALVSAFILAIQLRRSHDASGNLREAPGSPPPATNAEN